MNNKKQTDKNQTAELDQNPWIPWPNKSDS